MADCSTIPVARAPGTVPCAHCLGHVEDRLDLALLAARQDGPVTKVAVVAAWQDFRDRPVEGTWYLFVYVAARLLGVDATRRVLGDVDPWPITTNDQAFSAATKPARAVYVAGCAVCFTPAGGVQCAMDCQHSGCHNGWSAPARSDGRVFDCGKWVTPAEAFDCAWDAYSDLSAMLPDR